MKRFLYCLMTLLILGLTTLPCAATDYTKDAEKYVSTLSEAEMRDILPKAKAERARAEQLLRKSKGSSHSLAGVDQAAYKASYDYNTAVINAIERRLKTIDAKRAKEEEAKKKQENKDQQEQSPQDDNGAQYEAAKKAAMEESAHKYQNVQQNLNAGYQAIQEQDRGQETNRRHHQKDYGSVPEDLDTKINGSNSSSDTKPNSTTNMSDKFSGKQTKAEQQKKDSDPIQAMLDDLQSDIDKF